MKKQILTAALSAFVLSSILTGCNAAGTERGADTAKPTTDRAGNAIEIPGEVEKIISLNPATTQTLIDMGLSEKIVAVDEYSLSYADQLTEDIPVFNMSEPDQEAIVELEPDVVFTSGMVYEGGDNPYQTVQDAGVCVIDIPSSSSIAGIEEDITFIGDCVGAEAEAKTINEDFEAKVSELKSIGESIPEDERKTVVFWLSVPSDDYPTIYSVGEGTYIDEIITDIGAVNAAHDEGQWPALTEEAVVAMEPDCILHSVSYIDNATEVIKSRAGYENVPAVKNGEVYYIDENASNRPNAHVVDAMIQIAKDVYPDYYKDYADPFAQ